MRSGDRLSAGEVHSALGDVLKRFASHLSMPRFCSLVSTPLLSSLVSVTVLLHQECPLRKNSILAAEGCLCMLVNQYILALQRRLTLLTPKS